MLLHLLSVSWPPRRYMRYVTGTYLRELFPFIILSAYQFGTILGIGLTWESTGFILTILVPWTGKRKAHK